MQDGTSLLHSAIVSMTDNRIVQDEHRSDRYSALVKTFPCLCDGCLKKFVHQSVVSIRSPVLRDRLSITTLSSPTAVAGHPRRAFRLGGRPIPFVL